MSKKYVYLFSEGNDMRYSEKKVEAARNFACVSFWAARARTWPR